MSGYQNDEKTHVANAMGALKAIRSDLNEIEAFIKNGNYAAADIQAEMILKNQRFQLLSYALQFAYSISQKKKEK